MFFFSRKRHSEDKKTDSKIDRVRLSFTQRPNYKKGL